VLRTVGAYILAAALILFSPSAFRQALSEFRSTEPGSLLFGVLQLVIGTSAIAAAIGLVRRSRWAAWCIASWGVACALLLAVQPLYEPMDPDAQQSIWMGAALVVLAAAIVSWFAHRRAKGATVEGLASGEARSERPTDDVST
jgi:ABC-type cobalt transport system substrate-binding protein